MIKLKAQKLDRRMTGHQWYKYRVEFPMLAFYGVPGYERSGAYTLKTQVFTDLMYHLMQAHGFGPYVDYSHSAKDPKWAFRIADSNHVDTVYLSEEARLEFDKFMTFQQIKYSG